MKIHKSLVLVVAATAVLAGGCIPYTGVPVIDEWIFFFEMAFGGGSPYGVVAAKGTKIKVDESVQMELICTVGGLDGTYEIEVRDGEGTPMGTLTGTGKVKKGRFVSVKDKGSTTLRQIVTEIVSAQAQGEVTLTKVKGKVKASQEPGGAQSTYSLSVTYSGTVDSGPNAGAKLKKGKLTAGTTFNNNAD